MTLIKSISGIRGTLGGKPGESLSPLDVVGFVSAYATMLQQNAEKQKLKIVIGRDARTSGPMITDLVISSLLACGADVVDLGMATTPTVEMAVTDLKANGGIIITASHNPADWNALKFLNDRGEFITAEEGEEILKRAETLDINFASHNEIGTVSNDDTQLDKHIQKIIALPYVDINAIKDANFAVVIDTINSVGGIALPILLKALGVEQVFTLYGVPDGNFAHNPEPLPENLSMICHIVSNRNSDIGFVVDPDVDRLAIVCEDGSLFGEEYTLVAVADHILSYKQGPTVSNLSSTRALRDVTKRYDQEYYASAVGEVNVVEKMKMVGAVIGGEGNGGVILPDLHYGRDALLGIALMLTKMAHSGKTCTQIRASYPDYFMAKKKIGLSETTKVDNILWQIESRYKDKNTNTVDGLKIEFDNEWVHMRKSNTEPIIRVYTESPTQEGAEALAEKFIKEIETVS